MQSRITGQMKEHHLTFSNIIHIPRPRVRDAEVKTEPILHTSWPIRRLCAFNVELPRVKSYGAALTATNHLNLSIHHTHSIRLGRQGA